MSALSIVTHWKRLAVCTTEVFAALPELTFFFCMAEHAQKMVVDPEGDSDEDLHNREQPPEAVLERWIVGEDSLHD
ncbi:hypothetical protein RB195_019343 [Necator americanus]|uniref:Uncharacterized protein n=1 Tax=Necator americanus TaxID=51031 RepID=A0ABR1CGJ7_NECAM